MGAGHFPRMEDQLSLLRDQGYDAIIICDEVMNTSENTFFDVLKKQ